MPDQFERHGRGAGWDTWGPTPGRSQQRAAAAADSTAPVPKKAPGKKDPDLCKAAHWKGPHAPELRVRQFTWKTGTCHWGTSYLDHGTPVWHCTHEEVCTGCGKVLRISVSRQECPDFHDITPEKAGEVAADYERRRKLMEGTRRRLRPVIDGPQGYRKKKG
jgi:hypothetical protein